MLVKNPYQGLIAATYGYLKFCPYTVYKVGCCHVPVGNHQSKTSFSVEKNKIA